MKLLFTDIDGVLNSSAYADTLDHEMVINGNGDFPDIDHEAVARLNKIILDTGCEVVLSSGWRFFPNIREFLKEQGLCKDVLGVTPVLFGRGNEITAYMKNFDVESYAVLDDNDFDISRMHGNNFVQTSFQYGLTDEDAKKVTSILNQCKPPKCFMCIHYGALFNYGYWWCNLQHDEMNAEKCEDYCCNSSTLKTN